jgi:ferredoxin-NADP reductase
MFGLLHTHPLVFQKRSPVDGGVWSFVFSHDAPTGFRAGQHGLLRLGGATAKAFSLASAPEEDAVLIGTSLASKSSFKTRLTALQPGDRVTLHGPLLNFTLDKAHPHVVLLAQGVGITPFRSMLGHIATAGLPTQTSLVHVAHDGHAYRADTQRWAGTADYPQHAEQFRALVATAIQAHPDATFYVAGAPTFVTATISVLRQHHIASSNIRQDKYTGYKPGPRPAPTTPEESQAASRAA